MRDEIRCNVCGKFIGYQEVQTPGGETGVAWGVCPQCFPEIMRNLRREGPITRLFYALKGSLRDVTWPWSN